MLFIRVGGRRKGIEIAQPCKLSENLLKKKTDPIIFYDGKSLALTAALATGRFPPRGSSAHARQRASVGKISAKCCSFSAVSAPIFASKYAFDSIFQNLPDSQAEIFEI